jgi:hypothetical protein
VYFAIVVRQFRLQLTGYRQYPAKQMQYFLLLIGIGSVLLIRHL